MDSDIRLLKQILQMINDNARGAPRTDMVDPAELLFTLGKIAALTDIALVTDIMGGAVKPARTEDEDGIGCER